MECLKCVVPPIIVKTYITVASLYVLGVEILQKEVKYLSLLGFNDMVFTFTTCAVHYV